MQRVIHGAVFLDAELKKWGNSYGIRVSKETAEKLDLQPGDPVEFNLVKKSKKFDGFGICKGLAPFERDPHDDFRDV